MNSQSAMSSEFLGSASGTNYPGAPANVLTSGNGAQVNSYGVYDNTMPPAGSSVPANAVPANHAPGSAYVSHDIKSEVPANGVPAEAPAHPVRDDGSTVKAEHETAQSAPVQAEVPVAQMQVPAAQMQVPVHAAMHAPAHAPVHAPVHVPVHAPVHVPAPAPAPAPAKAAPAPAAPAPASPPRARSTRASRRTGENLEAAARGLARQRMSLYGLMMSEEGRKRERESESEEDEDDDETEDEEIVSRSRRRGGKRTPAKPAVGARGQVRGRQVHSHHDLSLEQQQHYQAQLQQQQLQMQQHQLQQQQQLQAQALAQQQQQLQAQHQAQQQQQQQQQQQGGADFNAQLQVQINNQVQSQLELAFAQAVNNGNDQATALSFAQQHAAAYRLALVQALQQQQQQQQQGAQEPMAAAPPPPPPAPSPPPGQADAQHALSQQHAAMGGHGLGSHMSGNNANPLQGNAINATNGGAFVVDQCGEYRYNHDANAVRNGHPYPVQFLPAASAAGRGFTHEEAEAPDAPLAALLASDGLVLVRGNEESRAVAREVLMEARALIQKRFRVDVCAGAEAAAGTEMLGVTAATPLYEGVKGEQVEAGKAAAEAGDAECADAAVKCEGGGAGGGGVEGECTGALAEVLEGASEGPSEGIDGALGRAGSASSSAASLGGAGESTSMGMGVGGSADAKRGRRGGYAYGHSYQVGRGYGAGSSAEALFRVIPSKRVLFPLPGAAGKFLYSDDGGYGGRADEVKVEAKAETPGAGAEAGVECGVAAAALSAPASAAASACAPVDIARLRAGLYRYLHKDACFRVAARVSELVLGAGYRSRGFKCMYSGPLTQMQTPHRDTLATEVNCFLALTHTTPELGSPVFFPGSHDRTQPQRPPVQFELFPGDLVLFNSTLGHYGTTTSRHRPMGFFSFKGRSRMRTASQRVRESSPQPIYAFDEDDPRFPLVFKNNEGDAYSV